MSKALNLMHRNPSAKSFAELNEQIKRRAAEARPELSDSDSDAESEPEMDWIKDLKTKVASMSDKPKAIGPKPPPGFVTSPYGTIKSPDDDQDAKLHNEELHNIPSPLGSVASSETSGGSLRPPTPLSLSEGAESPARSGTSTPLVGQYSPVRSSSLDRDMQDPDDISDQFSPSQVSPAATSPNADKEAAPEQRATSPSTFTPVQMEDANVFTPKYFELVTQRMEQDRERQRRKEDNSGFLKSAGEPEAEMDQMLSEVRPISASDLEQMKRERKDYQEAKAYD